VKDIDFSYYITEKVKMLNSSNFEIVNKTIDFDNVIGLTFLSNDTLKLMNENRNEIILNIKDINEVSRTKENFSPVLGGVLGGLGGTLAGALTGYKIAGFKRPEKIQDFMGVINTTGYTIIGGLIGLAVGTISGVLITDLINTENLELEKVPVNKKRNKLIKFLK
jgi:hypothetical protein